MSNKISWKIVLAFASILFVYSLLTKNIYVTIVALLIGVICEKFGYNTLFKSYDVKKTNKLKELKRRKVNNE